MVVSQRPGVLIRSAAGASASTIFGTLTRARARRRFQIAVSFFSFSSADRAGDAAVGGAGRRWCRRRSSIAAELGGGCRRPPVPRRRRRGAPACSCSRFSGWISGWRGGALDWRWQPTGAGDLFFMDRRWPSAAEAAAGRPRPRAATLGHAAVRAQELLRVNHFRHPHARAREAPIPDRGFIF